MPIQSKPYTLLITDDDYISRSILKRSLKSLALPVREAANGEEALMEILLIGNQPIILLLDLNMPVMSGYDVILQMRDNPVLYSHVTTIVISSALAFQFAETGLQKYVHAYFEKPADTADLLKEINALIA